MQADLAASPMSAYLIVFFCRFKSIPLLDHHLSHQEVVLLTACLAQMMSTFKYDEKLAPNQIRLIQLFPGQWLDDLESRLYLADRDHKYQALSYAWGSSKRSNQVSVNGKIHKITFNLDRALRSVRRQTEIITLWVDSICINQDDATEKGQQVGWMHDIFGSAMGVTAYIGDGLDRSRKDYSRSFEMLGQNPLVDFEPLDSWTSEPKNHLDGLRDSVPASLTEHQEIVYLFSLLMLFFYSSPFGREMMRLDQSLHQYNVEHNLSDAQLQPVIERMRLFATSDWWNRMWIVQEACAARQLTVVYGRASVPFSYIEEAAQGYLQSPTAKHPDLARVMRFLADKITPISPARRLGRTKEKVVLSATTSSSLLWLLRRFRHRKSSEPRDKIFALLKLAEDMKARRPFQHNQMTIEADYEDDVSEVFSHAAFEIIRHTGLLWMTTSDLLAKSRKDIPSWVPDWSSEYMASGFDQRRYRLQEATVLGYNAGRARFQHFRSISREDSVRNLPRQHLEALLNYDDDEWKPVHSLPTMIKYTSSPPFREKMQRSALIIKGVACSVIGVASQVIRSDLSNIGQAVVQIQASYGRPKGRQIYRKPFLETVAACLSMSMQILRHNDGSLRTLELPKRQELSYWVFRQYVGALELMNRYEDLSRDFASTAATCPKGYGIVAMASKEEPKLRFQPDASTSLAGDGQQWSGNLDVSESYELARLPKDFAWFQDRAEGLWIEDTVRTMAAGNRLFVTDRGLIGLGPGNMCVGDEICVLEGGLMPYVLRKHVGTIYTESSRVHQMESIMGVHRFTMVGSCYADGIMHWGDEEHGWGENADDIEELDSKLRRRLNAPELVETAFLLV